MMKLAEGPYVLVVHPSLPVKNVAEPHRARESQAQHDRLRLVGKRQRAAPRGRTLRHAWRARPARTFPTRASSQAMNDVLGGNREGELRRRAQRAARTSRPARSRRSP